MFSYPNGEISFHEDLKIYYEILSNIRSHTPSLLALLERANEPQDALDRVIDELLAVIKNYALPFLAQNDVYDSTVDDFLQDNTGYNRMFEALELF